MQPLADRLARGEESAFTELYDSCADRLLSYLTLRMGCPESAGDALQSAMLRAVKSRRHFARVENPVAYLYQIARNEAFRQAKKNRSSTTTEDNSAEYPEARNKPCFDTIDLAVEALKRLSTDDREIVELKIFGGLTFRDIAMVTKSPQGTVATNYRRALESLRPWLARQLQGDSPRGAK